VDEDENAMLYAANGYHVVVRFLCIIIIITAPPHEKGKAGKVCVLI